MEMVERKDTGVTRHAGGWIVLAAGLLLVCLWSAVSSTGGPIPPADSLPAIDSSAARTSGEAFPTLTIDINQASEAELSCIAGIGPTLASRIVATRRQLGSFSSLDQLEAIPGVGPRLAAKLDEVLQPLGPQPHATALTPEYSTSNPRLSTSPNNKHQSSEAMHD